MDDLHLHFIVRELGQRVIQHLRRALHVALDDQRKVLDIACGKLLVELLEGESRALGQRRLAQLGEPVKRNLPRLERIFDHLQAVADLRHIFQAQNFHRRRGRRLDNRPAAIIEHGAHFPENRAHDERVPHPQRAVLNEDAGHRPAAAIELAFEHSPGSQPLRIGLQRLKVGHQQHHLEQQLEIGFLLGRNFHHHRIPAPSLGQ